MIWQDCKHAVRSLKAKPGFTVVTLLTLAIGIGATTKSPRFDFSGATATAALPVWPLSGVGEGVGVCCGEGGISARGTRAGAIVPEMSRAPRRKKPLSMT